MAPRSNTQVLVQRKTSTILEPQCEPVASVPTSKGYQLKNPSPTSNKLLRYQVLTFVCLFVGYAVYNLTRKAITYVAPTLMLGGILSQNQTGLLNSAQSTAYAVSKFLAGVLSDKFSARKLFSIGLFVSGLSAVCVASTDNPNLWIALWFLNGLAQGCGWPSCSKLIKKWFSPKHFGTCWSLLTASSNVAGTVGPLISAYILMNFSWKISVLSTGIFSVIMGLTTLTLLADEPTQLGLSVDSVKISKEPTKTTGKEENNMTWNALLRSPLLWVIAGSYLVVFGIKTSLTDWSQVYLIQGLGYTQMQASSFSSSFESGGFAGGILAGVLTDRLTKVSSGSNSRLTVASAFLLATVCGLHVMSFQFAVDSSTMFTSAVAFVLGASVFGPISIFGIVASESFPQSISGSAHAVAALAANGGAIFAGWPLSKMAQLFGWGPVLTSLEGLAFLVICGIHLSGPWHSVQKTKKL